MLGIPSLQIELPRGVRALMMCDPTRFVKGVAQAFYETYKEVVVPAWALKTTLAASHKEYLVARIAEQTTATNIKYLAYEYKHWDS